MNPTSAMVTSAKRLPASLVTFLEAALTRAGLQGCYVTSVARTVAEQAVAMLENCLRTGVAEQYGIYLNAGDQVIKVVEDHRDQLVTGFGRGEVLRLMMAKIEEVGPGNVSHHCLSANSPLIVCDIRKNSVLNHAMFRAAIMGHPQVFKLLDENNVFHLEIYKEAVPAVQST